MSMVVKSGTVAGIAAGTHTTVAASDAVATGLRKVHHCFATLASDPTATASAATAEIPNQITSPGVVNIKTWMPTGTADTAPVAATSFDKIVNWVAFGE